MNKYAEVILPLPLEGTFTYQVSKHICSLVPGSRVIVPFGAKKILTGVVYKLHDRTSQNRVAKYISEVLDDLPVVNSFQFRLFSWMADYYMCTEGEVMRAALPSALKLSSDSFVSLGTKKVEVTLSKHEYTILTALKKQDLSITELSTLTGLKNPHHIIKKLSEEGYLSLYEQVKDKYIPKKVSYISLSEEFRKETALEDLVNHLEKRPKQQDILLSYLQKVKFFEPVESNFSIPKNELYSKDLSKSSLKSLIKNGVLMQEERIVSRLEILKHKPSYTFDLSVAQATTLSKITSLFQDYATVLLHGITGSGKTEVYIKLIEQELELGKQVLYLLPEIALTTQIIARLQKVFGSSFGVYHSRYSDNERVEVWNKVLSSKYQLVVGVRSAIFLPFSNLGLVIVDEEHEHSYKQQEPNPRYHARDTAIYLSSLHGAKTLLGTATPSLETYQNMKKGKYGLVELFERFGQALSPQILLADTLKDKKKKKLKGNLSEILYQSVVQALKEKEQIILFQNRRGYAFYIQCYDCTTIPKCPNCAVSLTYHQYNLKLVCHYCGFSQPMHKNCLECGSTYLQNVGYGTEELEEELKELFPTAIVQRMDLDTTRSKLGYQKIIENFEEGNIDILVGTQIISKGLDFDRVNLVGIFDTDRLIHFPNFRSSERAYQLLKQVSGRSGRKSPKGKVIIQTNDPEQPLLALVQVATYQDFF